VIEMITDYSIVYEVTLYNPVTDIWSVHRVKAEDYIERGTEVFRKRIKIIKV